MEKRYRYLYDIVDEILWVDWDPIGINDNEAIRDEYRSYVPYIVKLKIEGSDLEKISKYLFQLESVSMGMDGNIEHCRYIAQKILDI